MHVPTHNQRARSSSPVGRAEPTVQALAQQIYLLQQELAERAAPRKMMNKPRDPEPFTGDSEQRKFSSVWIMGMDQQFELRGITTDYEKLLFATTCLKNAAMMWWANVKDYIRTWAEFKNAFNKNYQSVDVADKAGQVLLSLVQIGSVEKMNEVFRTNRYLANPKIYSEAILKELYWKALKPKIKLYISKHRMQLMGLEELMSAAQEADRELYALNGGSTATPNRPFDPPVQ